jgi:acyl carrier protein
MTRAEIQIAAIQALVSIAPEIGSTTLKPDVPLREQVDLDSMDFLRFVTELHRQFGVEIPEGDYEKLGTLAGVVGYLAAQLDVPAR